MIPNKQVNNIYGYVRVSTLEQARNGSSIELQKDMITEFVKDKYNREVTEFFADEGVSGTIPILDRPESRRLTDVMDEHDVIVTTRLDRFSRSSKNLLNIMPVLEDTKVTLFFCEQFGDFQGRQRLGRKIRHERDHQQDYGHGAQCNSRDRAWYDHGSTG